MRYRIRATVEGDQIADIVAAVFKNSPKLDPQVYVEPMNDIISGIDAEIAALKPPTSLADRFDALMTDGPNFRPSAADILHNALQKKPMRWKELTEIVKRSGYSPSAVNNFLTRGEKNGTLKRVEHEWALAE